MTHQLCMKRAMLATSAVAFTGKNNDATIVGSNGSVPPTVMMAPTLPIHIFRPNEHMEIAFDTRTRTPIYVMERLEGLSPDDPATQRRARFHEEAALPVEFRSRNGYYRGSGYDRGHLAPAADFRHLPPSVVQDTYTLCNTVPQVPTMNRHGWAQLEAWVRKVAEREKQATTYVITGPLWLPSSVSKENPGIFYYAYNGLGTPPALISVPTHLFKVIAVVRNNVIEKFAAFVMPNKEMDGGKVELSQYLVQLADLEAVCGMHFFPGMPQDFRKHADALTQDVRTNMRIEGKPILLLTEGGSQRKKNDVFVRKTGKLSHLCEGGRCQ